MRYYSGSRFRWLSPDPAGFVEGLNLYAMVGGNPVTHRDVMGMGRGILGLANRLMAVMRENIHIPGAVSHRALVSEESRKGQEFGFEMQDIKNRRDAAKRIKKIMEHRKNVQLRDDEIKVYRERVAEKTKNKLTISSGIKKEVTEFLSERKATVGKLHVPNLHHVALGYQLSMYQLMISYFGEGGNSGSKEEAQSFLNEFNKQYEKINANTPKEQQEHNIKDEDIVELQSLAMKYVDHTWKEALGAHLAGFAMGIALTRVANLSKGIKNPELKEAAFPLSRWGVGTATLLGHLGGMYTMEKLGKQQEELSDALMGGVPLIEVMRHQAIEVTDRYMQKNQENVNDLINEH